MEVVVEIVVVGLVDRDNLGLICIIGRDYMFKTPEISPVPMGI